jgi:integrase
MNDPEKIPMLLEFLFGKNASMAMRTTSPCLLAWSHAFETWVAELERTRHFKTPKRAKFIWQTFLNGCGKLPWEVTQEDVRAYVEGRVALGRARNTIKAEISILSKFYEWIACTGSDPQAKPDFNPASGVDKPKVVAHEHSQALSHTEAQILLDAFLRQGSVLSLRDHAFILIRLRVGRLHSELLELRWGQIETRAEGPWVRWNDGGADLLEYDAYAALLHYLRKSGRLDVLTPHSYVFVPMKPGRVTGEEAGDWNEVKIMDSDVFLLNLKRFGVVVGIPPERLNLHALRHTAIRRRVEAGASAQEIREAGSSRRHLTPAGSLHL